MNTFETLFSRKSVRQFTGETISDNELQQILLAANAAPVGMKRYEDVHLTVIQNQETLNKIEESAATLFNNPDMHPLYGAPVLILVSHRFSESTSPNVAYSDAAIIVHNMILAATELGIGAVYIWGAIAALIENKALVATLGLPDGFSPCCAVALGKTDEKYSLRDVPTDRITINYIK